MIPYVHSAFESHTHQWSTQRGGRVFLCNVEKTSRGIEENICIVGRFGMCNHFALSDVFYCGRCILWDVLFIGTFCIVRLCELINHFKHH